MLSLEKTPANDALRDLSVVRKTHVMTKQRYKVGIVGLEPGVSWSAIAHVPALRALSETFEITGVANTSLASAERAAAAMGLPRAFKDATELVTSPDVDIVTVTVKVPQHLQIVKAAIAAGKHVFCEWPLGNGLAETEALAALARTRGVLGVIGTQARVAPEIVHLKQLLADGFVGEVLSTTIVAHGAVGSGFVAQQAREAYYLDRANGATMLTIAVGHALSALREVLGEVASVSSVVATRRTTAFALDTGVALPVTAPDQVLVSGILASGAPVSIHYRGGMPRDGHGFLWEINGTEGDVRVSGPLGYPEMVPLTLSVARGDEKVFHPLEIPAASRSGFPEDATSGNVARVYARMANDLRDGTTTAPTFDDAGALHRVIDAIERAAETRTLVEGLPGGS